MRSASRILKTAHEIRHITWGGSVHSAIRNSYHIEGFILTVPSLLLWSSSGLIISLPWTAPHLMELEPYPQHIHASQPLQTTGMFVGFLRNMQLPQNSICPIGEIAKADLNNSFFESFLYISESEFLPRYLSNGLKAKPSM